MERHDAWAILVGTRVEVIDFLDQLDREDCTWTMMVIVLDQAVQVLHRACGEFEGGDAAELYEDCYLPLFDALSHLTQARYRCNGRGIRTNITERVKIDCEAARECFDEAVGPPLSQSH